MAKTVKKAKGKTALKGGEAKQADLKPSEVQEPKQPDTLPVEAPVEMVQRPDQNPKDKRQERAERQARNKAEREAKRAERQAERQTGKNLEQKQGKPAATPAGKTAELPADIDLAQLYPPLSDLDQIEWRHAPAGPMPAFNILVIAQEGKLAREAAVFAVSLRLHSPGWKGRLIVAEPQPEGAWQGRKTLIQSQAREVLTAMGAEITPFTAQHFGRDYPYGNKIEALSVLPADEPFVFFDSDTLITGALDQIAFDFSRPSASMQREGSWPEPPLYGPGYDQIWGSLYDRFGLDFGSSLDLTQPEAHWERYLYFNAGWFFGADPAEFGRRFLDYALAVRNDPGEALATQSLDPWLDQAVLPLVIHSLGGGRPTAALAGLDGETTSHYRNLSLLYGCGSDKAVAAYEQIAAIAQVRSLMQGDTAYHNLFEQGQGRSLARPLFAGRVLPSRQQAIRQRLKRESLWFGR